MLKVLIADDELKVGKLVEALVDWDNLELSLVDVVQDGQIAYEVIMQQHPDIVITDIRMPSLSGLELIERITKADPTVRFIVISGYRYFEYAQTALKYGVEDYLLKPIDEKELNKILARVCQEEQERRSRDVQVESLQKKFRNSKHILHRELMESVFVNSEAYEVETVNREYGVELGNGVFKAIGYKADRDLSTGKNRQQEKLISQKLAEIVNGNFEPLVNDIVISEKEGMTILVLLNYEETRADQINKVIQDVFRLMKQYLNDFVSYDITMGTGQQVYEFSRINLTLEMAKEALDYRIFEGTGRCIDNYSEERNPDKRAQDIIESRADDFRKSIDILDEELLGNIIKECFRAVRQENLMASEVYELARKLFGEYCDLAAELFQADMKAAYGEWLEECGHCSHVQVLEQYTMRELCQHISSLKQARREKERRPVQEAIAYIKTHCGEKILLEELAEKSGFNANYFSEMFKSETGRNFTTYLLEVRMEKARVLLRDSTDTIYEVAEKVGYKDSKFFSQQFTKVVGIKPTEYRKLYY